MTKLDSRIKRLEHNLCMDDNVPNTEVVLVVVRNREQVADMKQIPIGTYVEGIKTDKNGNKVIAAGDYLKLVGEQYPELLPITEGPTT